MNTNDKNGAEPEVDSISLLVAKLKTKGIDAHCYDGDVFSFSIDGVCFTISAQDYHGQIGRFPALNYEHESN